MAFKMRGSKFYGGGNQSKKSVLKAKETEAEFLARMESQGQKVSSAVEIGDKAIKPGSNIEDSITGESTTAGNSKEHKYLRNIKRDQKQKLTFEQAGRLKELDMKFLRNKGFVDGNKSEGFDTPTDMSKTPTTMKKAPMKKGKDGCGGNFKVNKPGTVVSRALKKAGGNIKQTVSNVASNIKDRKRKIKSKKNQYDSKGGSHKTPRYL